MNANRQVWGAKHPGAGVGGTNGAPPQQVIGGKRQPKEGMGANNMGARKPMEAIRHHISAKKLKMVIFHFNLKCDI